MANLIPRPGWWPLTRSWAGVSEREREGCASLDVARRHPGVLILFRSLSQNGIHIYERQESKKEAPRRRARCGLANICADTCTRFNPLSTCWHAGIRAFFLSSSPLTLSFSIFLFTGADVASLSKELIALIEMGLFFMNFVTSRGTKPAERSTFEQPRVVSAIFIDSRSL